MHSAMTDTDCLVLAGDVDASRYNLYERVGCKGESLIARSGYDTVAECQAWCDERDGCAAFTLNAERGRCYLKASCDERETEPTNVSGIRISAGARPCRCDPRCCRPWPSAAVYDAAHQRGPITRDASSC